MQLPRFLASDPSDPRSHQLPVLALAALVLLASATSLSNGFAYDDRWIILDNPNVHSLKLWYTQFGETYWPAIRGAALYRPFTIIAYILQWAAGGGTPLIFHVMNVVLYGIATIVVYRLACELLPRSAAWLAAALFAVHPVHVEAVGNVVGQAELWGGIALIGAVALYLHARRDGLPLTRETTVYLCGIYFGGMLFKENAIVLPALIVAAELFVVRDARTWRERAVDVRPLLIWLALLAVIFLGIRIFVTGEIGGDVEHPSLRNLTMWQRCWVMLALAPEFARLLIWPARLYADYSPREVPVEPSPSLAHLNGALLILCLAILAGLAVRRFPIAAFGLAWIAITLGPVANILLPTGILIAERTLFLPSVGAVIIAASAVPWCIDRLRESVPAARTAALALLVLLLGVGAAHSAERQRTWHDTDSVFRALITDAPLSFKSHYANGGMLWEQHRPGEAEREWRIAIALFPDYFGVYQDLGHKYREAHVCQAAIPMYQKALAIEPALPFSRVGLVACYLEVSNFKKARAEARVALADGMYRRAYEFMIDRADSALVATDSLDGENRWKPSKAGQKSGEAILSGHDAGADAPRKMQSKRR